MSDEVLIEISCQGGGEGAGAVGLGVASAAAAGGDVRHRSTGDVGSRRQDLLAGGATHNYFTSTVSRETQLRWEDGIHIFPSVINGKSSAHQTDSVGGSSDLSGRF